MGNGSGSKKLRTKPAGATRGKKRGRKPKEEPMVAKVVRMELGTVAKLETEMKTRHKQGDKVSFGAVVRSHLPPPA